MLNWHQTHVNSWHQVRINHRSKMNVFVINVKLGSNWCLTLTLKKINQHYFSTKLIFQPNFFSPNIFYQWPFSRNISWRYIDCMYWCRYDICNLILTGYKNQVYWYCAMILTTFWYQFEVHVPSWKDSSKHGHYKIVCLLKLLNQH